jgi:hypothetical protein
MQGFSSIASGGQTGVDRAALDFAIARAFPYRGWCPKGGWAEDMPEAPGLLARYPNLRETPLADPRERTEWNVRDSDGTLVFLPSAPECSPGTQFTLACAEKYGKPLLVADPHDATTVEVIRNWLHENANIRVLNIAGPRESESPGIYTAVYSVLTAVSPNAT